MIQKTRRELNLEQKRFTLVRGNWYAAEIISEQFEPAIRDYSPIKVLGIRPKKTGTSLFSLNFHHASYPAGVNGKVYNLKTIERTKTFILAKSTDHSPTRFLLIYSIDAHWLRKHFNVDLDKNSSVDEWLTRNT